MLIREATPLRLHDLSEDPRSVGFPPGHPPMHSFLGVPILLRGVAYGNLYLTEKTDGGDYTDDDQELVTHLASQAAVAIENARLFEASTRWSRQLESLIEVGNALATETDVSAPARPGGDAAARADRGAAAHDPPPGRRRASCASRLPWVRAPRSWSASSCRSRARRAAACFERRRSERVDSVIDDPEVSREVTRRLAARAGLWVPLVVRDRAIGVIGAYDKLGDERRLHRHGPATGRDVREPRVGRDRPLPARRARRAAPHRRRAGGRAPAPRPRAPRRDRPGAHVDPARPRLARGQPRDEASARGREERARARRRARSSRCVSWRSSCARRCSTTSASCRRSSGSPQTLVEQSDLEIEFLSRIDDRLPEEVETALYRIVQEALTNVVKHANARQVSIVLARKDRVVTALIEDDGRGFDPAATREGGFGLEGMRERVALLGGTLRSSRARTPGRR